MRYFLRLKYDGSKFYGSQVQNNKVTVCGVLNNTLSKLFNSEIKVVACSRTDKGVHANDFVVHFDVSKEIELNKLLKSLNKLVMPNIFVKEVYINNSLHARYDVLKKTYVYKINVGEFEPTMCDTVFQYNKNINISLIKKAISKLNGEHNFLSFTSDKDKNNYIRNIKISIKKDKDMVLIYFKSKGFLRYMIRNIVGLLIDINESVKSVDDIDKIFLEKNRSILGKPASACGLYLERIEY